MSASTLGLRRAGSSISTWTFQKHVAWPVCLVYSGTCLPSGVRVKYRVTDARGTKDVQYVIPGRQTMGTDRECVIQTASDGTRQVQAMLHWGGRGTEIVLAPMPPFGAVKLDGRVVVQPVRLAAGVTLQAGQLTMRLEYP